jgi:hypothetical protein
MVMSNQPYEGLQPWEEVEKGARLKVFVRFLPIPLLAVGLTAAWQPPNCLKNVCPAYSLESPWILRTERGLFAGLALLLVLMVVVKLVVEGEMPEHFGREGFGWRKAIEVSTDEILDYVIAIDGDLQEFKENFPEFAEEPDRPES